MRLFRKKSAVSTELTQYLSGWEVVLDGEHHCMSFIQTQLVDKRTAQNSGTYIELTYGPDRLLKGVKTFSEGVEENAGDQEHMKIEEAIGKLPYHDFAINQLYSIQPSNSGLNYLGGQPTDGFRIPENNCPGSYQYLGMLSKQDPAFSWLPFDVQLICPIYMDFHQLWVDYGDPLNPLVMNKEEVEESATAYDDLKADSFIIFKEQRFSSKKVSQFDSGMMSGAPEWIQYPDIPLCPKSNRTMKFLCQLGDGIDIGVAETNIQPKDEWYEQYFESMNFWGDGVLYVFFEPETKIACYQIQNS